MDRRGFIALLAPLTAGCFGGASVNRRNEMPPPSETAEPTENGTETPEPTATPTPEPTATPESTPSAAERKADRLLRTARERIRAAVDAYADSGDLADVHADTDDFVAREVYVALVRASSAVNEAAVLAETDDQTATATSLEGVVAFLSRATAGQAAAIAGHDALLAVRDELKDENVGSAESSVDAVDRHRSDVERAVSHIESESDDADLEATDAVDDDARSTKLAQLEAAATALDEAASPARMLVDGVDLLASAREAVDDGDDSDRIADLANEAEDALGDVYDDLDGLADDLPDTAGPFEDAVETLADYASERQSDAEDLAVDYGG